MYVMRISVFNKNISKVNAHMILQHQLNQEQKIKQKSHNIVPTQCIYQRNAFHQPFFVCQLTEHFLEYFFGQTCFSCHHKCYHIHKQ